MRAQGYFWVRYENEWHIAEWDYNSKLGDNVWWVCGFPDYFTEEDLQEIDEKMIPKHKD